MSLHVFSETQKWARESGIVLWSEEKTTSTNAIAKESTLAGAPVRLFLTDHQSAGRGRGKNQWLQSENSGSTFLTTWAFHLGKKNPQPVLSPAIGYALWSALQTSFPWVKFALKAPNDLYCEDRKIAGLLLEICQQQGENFLLIGLGMNVLAAPDMMPTAGALQNFLSIELTTTVWRQILDRLLLEFSLALSQTDAELSPTQQQSLLYALNRFSKLEKAYQKVDKDGSLWIDSEIKHWSEL
ncbi:MAG: biotin synthetase [Bdellovibrio sp. CG10_big_fil_rev_8_21_14_0_10_47_8]|nr:MAG: biotin synthetase [Bdellovibrio sp. CG10_big_fil_rev_8_21_14_0_10_47_8]